MKKERREKPFPERKSKTEPNPHTHTHSPRILLGIHCMHLSSIYNIFITAIFVFSINKEFLNNNQFCSFSKRKENLIMWKTIVAYSYMVLVIFYLFLIVANCTFDKSFCGWRNVLSPEDDIQWIPRKSATPSQGTGPSQDHTGI